MKKGGTGGATTSQNGINFEKRVDILSKLKELPGYAVDGNIILYENKIVAYSFAKGGLYKHLKEMGVNWEDYISKKLLPDDAIYVLRDNTLYIIEIKFQTTSGSVDEKLQTCDFKKRQYKKLFSSLNYEVEYIYILNDWFKHTSYKDVRDYILSVGCHFYFEHLPLEKIGLPLPK